MQKITDDFQQLRKRRPFNGMNIEHFNWLVDHLEFMAFPPDTAILSTGMTCDRLYFIHTGTIHLEATGNADHDRKVLAELREGESFPLQAFEEQRPVLSTFRAHSATECYRFSREVFEQLKAMSDVFSDFCRYSAAGLSFQEDTITA